MDLAPKPGPVKAVTCLASTPTDVWLDLFATFFVIFIHVGFDAAFHLSRCVWCVSQHRERYVYHYCPSQDTSSGSVKNESSGYRANF